MSKDTSHSHWVMLEPSIVYLSMSFLLLSYLPLGFSWLNLPTVPSTWNAHPCVLYLTYSLSFRPQCSCHFSGSWGASLKLLCPSIESLMALYFSFTEHIRIVVIQLLKLSIALVTNYKIQKTGTASLLYITVFFSP